MDGGEPVPSVAVLSHDEQLDRLRRYVPEAVDVALVAGDPCFDRLLASRPLRETYRGTFGVRPESLRLTSTEDPESLTLTVELVEELGADALIHGSIDVDGAPQRFVVRADGRTPPALGERVHVTFRDSDEIHVFHPETGNRIAAV